MDISAKRCPICGALGQAKYLSHHIAVVHNIARCHVCEELHILASLATHVALAHPTPLASLVVHNRKKKSKKSLDQQVSKNSKQISIKTKKQIGKPFREEFTSWSIGNSRWVPPPPNWFQRIYIERKRLELVSSSFKKDSPVSLTAVVPVDNNAKSATRTKNIIAETLPRTTFYGEESPCSCGGENESCCKCNGTGRYLPELVKGHGPFAETDKLCAHRPVRAKSECSFSKDFRGDNRAIRENGRFESSPNEDNYDE